jgi:hypothetical protein
MKWRELRAVLGRLIACLTALQRFRIGPSLLAAGRGGRTASRRSNSGTDYVPFIMEISRWRAALR